MDPMKKALYIGFWALLAFRCEAIVIRDDRSYSDHDVLKTLPNIGAVVRMRGTFGDDVLSSNTYLASGVHIGHGLILTAGHVVYGDGKPLIGLRAFNFSGNGWTIPLSKVRTHPGFDGSNYGGTYQYDLSLLWIGGDFTSWDFIQRDGTPALPSVSLWGGKLDGGSEVYLAGYGRQGTGLNPGLVPSGNFAVGQNVYDSSDFGGAVGYVDFDAPSGGPDNTGGRTPLDLEAMINPGDSGGGWLSLQNGQLSLTHITSGLWGNLDGTPDGGYGDLGMGVSVSTYLPWIQEQALDLGAISNVGDLHVVPEPSVSAMASVGGILTGLWLRRKRKG